MQTEVNTLPGSQMQILPATWRDLNELRKLETICFQQDAWPLIDLVGVLSFGNIVRYKAVLGEKMIGFVAGEQGQEAGLGWIATFAVLPEYRRQGIGSALLDTCEAALEAKRIRLTVQTGNTAAIQLYKKYGYQTVGLWPSYYRSGEDAVVFEKVCLE
ncbi:MAG: GNAT family N-acetyltransferase [Anaerolineae bacterium]|nr:GNAT family N-acetyltransferase [Anaerolineae bacterium]